MHGTTIRSRDWSRSAIAMLAALLVAAVVLIIARTGAANVFLLEDLYEL